MKIYIICSVRDATKEYQKMLEKYVQDLEDQQYEVHLPHRDTKQNAKGYNICKQNMDAIIWASEIHIFYNSKSQGSHFDLGMAFILNKKIVIIENEEFGKGKSFPRMLTEWHKHQKKEKKKLKYEFKTFHFTNY